jgi:hypothetical protein
VRVAANGGEVCDGSKENGGNGGDIAEAKAAGLPDDVAGFQSDFTSVDVWIWKVYRNPAE